MAWWPYVSTSRRGLFVSSFNFINVFSPLLWCSVVRARPEAALATGSHPGVSVHNHILHGGRRSNNLQCRDSAHHVDINSRPLEALCWSSTPDWSDHAQQRGCPASKMRYKDGNPMPVYDGDQDLCCTF